MKNTIRLLFIALLVLTFSACHSVTKETVEVNGKDISKKELDAVVSSLLQDADSNFSVRKWNLSKDEIYCGVVGLTKKELEHFNKILQAYLIGNGLKVNTCKLSNNEPVSFLFIYLEDATQLLQIPMIKKIYSNKDVKLLKENGVYRLVESIEINKNRYIGRFRSHRILAKNEILEKVIRGFEEDIIFSLVGGRVSDKILSYDANFRKSFINAYYSNVVHGDLKKEDLSKIISKLMFAHLKQHN